MLLIEFTRSEVDPSSLSNENIYHYPGIQNMYKGRDPFNQTFRKFRSKTQWIGSVQPEKFRKNGSTFWGGPLFSVGPVWILVEWIAPMESSRSQLKDAILNTHIKIRHGWFFIFFPVPLRNNTNWYIMYHTSCVTGKGWLKNNNPFRNMRVLVKISTVKW